MEIAVNTNLIRLFPRHFLFLQAKKQGRIQDGSIYRINTPHGAMGSAQCVSVTTHTLGTLTRAVTMMAESSLLSLYQDRMKNEGYFSLDVFQVCLFTWLKRSVNFNTLLDAALRDAGIPIIQQNQLF